MSKATFDPTRYNNNHNETFSEVLSLIDTDGLPHDDYHQAYKHYVNEAFEKFIEIQVWDDSPLD